MSFIPRKRLGYHVIYVYCLPTSTIVLANKYYRVEQKVLSCWVKSTIVLNEKYYRVEQIQFYTGVNPNLHGSKF